MYYVKLERKTGIPDPLMKEGIFWFDTLREAEKCAEDMSFNFHVLIGWDDRAVA